MKYFIPHFIPFAENNMPFYVYYMPSEKVEKS